MGTGFTGFTLCQYTNSTLSVPTMYISSELIQCTVTPQNLASSHTVYDEQSFGILVQEHSLYDSNSVIIGLDYSPYVSSISPTFIGEETREVLVYVSNLMPSTYEFCSANQTIVVPVVRT